MSSSSIARLFLVHHTHMDIGYTDLAYEVRAQHLNHLDRVLAICAGNADRAEHCQFRWTCESALLVKDYLECRPKACREALLHALRASWIELQTFLTQPLTELCSAQELIDCLSYAVHLGKSEGFEVSCGMIDDIGGYAGRLPTVMSQLGIRYLVAGVGAFQVHLPWADLPHLFYLECPDAHRILVWNLGIDRTRTPQEMKSLCAVYGQGALHLIQPFAKALLDKHGRGVELDVDTDRLSTDARARFAEFEERLARESYPYDDVLLQYGGDNQGPDADLLDLLRHINQRDDMPSVQLTTPTVFFRHMEQRHGDQIPVLRGIITDPWTLRAPPQPETLARYREGQRLMECVEARRALTGAPVDRHARELVQEAATMLQFGSDHTCGLSEWGWEKEYETSYGTRAAAFDRYRTSWADKRGYADHAVRLLRSVEFQQKQFLAGVALPESDVVAIWNDQSVAHGGPTDLYTGRGSEPVRELRDVTDNQAVLFQKVGPARYVVDSPPVPAYGVRFLKPAFGNSQADIAEKERPEQLKKTTLEVQFDERTGAVLAVRDTDGLHQYVDSSAEANFAVVEAYNIEGVAPGPVQAGMSQNLNLERRPAHLLALDRDDSGPVFSLVRSRHRIEGQDGPVMIDRDIRIFRGLPRLDVIVRIDKPESHLKECLLLPFPFAGTDGAYRFDQAIGIVRPANDLLPGAMQDLFYAHSWVRLDAADWGVTVVCPDSPVIQCGDHGLGHWRDDIPFSTRRNAVTCQLYHNLLNTDCPIWQDILTTVRFTLWFDDQGAAWHDGEICRAAAAAMPMQADVIRTCTPGDGAPSPALRCEPADVRVLSLRKTSKTGVAVLLENTSPTSIVAEVSLGQRLVGAWKTTVGAKRLADCEVTERQRVMAHLDAFEVCCIHAELEQPLGLLNGRES